MSLVTLQQVKDWLGVTSTSQDAVLETVQSSVEGLVLDYCECSFSPVVVTGELQDAGRSDTIVVEHFPIISVQALYFGVDATGAYGALLEPDSYIVRPHEIVLRSMHTGRGRGYIRIDYTHGYESVPSQVMMAVLLSCEAFYYRRNRKSVDISSRSKEGESESFTSAWDTKTGLPKAAVQMLGSYRSIQFPVSPMASSNR